MILKKLSEIFINVEDNAALGPIMHTHLSEIPSDKKFYSYILSIFSLNSGFHLLSVWSGNMLGYAFFGVAL